MCSKHSLLISRDGKIFDGFGIVHSHTVIADLHNINEDAMNKYECEPRFDAKKENIIGWYINIDSRVFDPENDAAAIESYLQRVYPTVKSWHYPTLDIKAFWPAWVRLCERYSWDYDLDLCDEDWVTQTRRAVAEIVTLFGDELTQEQIADLVGSLLYDDECLQKCRALCKKLLATQLYPYSDAITVRLVRRFKDAIYFGEANLVHFLLPYISVKDVYSASMELFERETRHLPQPLQRELRKQWEA